MAFTNILEKYSITTFFSVGISEHLCDAISFEDPRMKTLLDMVNNVLEHVIPRYEHLNEVKAESAKITGNVCTQIQAAGALSEFSRAEGLLVKRAIVDGIEKSITALCRDQKFLDFVNNFECDTEPITPSVAIF